MFIRAMMIGVSMLFAAASVPAQAAQFTVSARGTVSDLHDSNSKSIAGAFKQGDPYSLDVKANIDAASLWFESNDRTTAFYNVPLTFTFAAGSLVFSGDSVQTLSITNNTNCSGYCTAADSAYLLSLGFSRVLDTPAFDLGLGSYYQSLNIQFFDIAGTTFNGTGLDQLAKIASFRAPTFNYQLTQVSSPSKAAFASLTNLDYNVGVTSAVPELTSWVMMILGFSVVGVAMRRGRNVTTGISFAD